VQFAFFGAYGIGSLIYYIISMVSGDPINRMATKIGVIIGLLSPPPAGVVLSGSGAGLLSIFSGGAVRRGIGLRDVADAANPYVTILGPEETASARLNLSQAFNSFGTTIGPIIGGWLIFTFFTSKDAHGRTR